jgi:ribosome maturation factor RimP
LREARDGQWRMGGRLVAVDDDGVTLEEDSQREQHHVRWDMIADTRLQITF